MEKGKADEKRKNKEKKYFSFRFFLFTPEDLFPRVLSFH
jgi:hypothetical protein